MSFNTADPTVSIPAFFAGQSIFVTGATGFMGKVLIEKLLRSCPDIQEIFLLIRPKKKVAVADRLQQMLSNAIFDRVKKERPTVIQKLIAINGNCGTEGLGLSPADRKEIVERVSIIFHVAATVRFNDSLKYSVLMNVRSTRDICILATEMKNLIAFVHVSSTYAHTDKPEVEEIVYPGIADWKKTIQIAETLDEHTLNTSTSKFLGRLSNTYTFSKNLAEQVINDYADKLPLVIFRPSIVTSTLDEPFRGWVDNLNGPIGMSVGIGKGVIRVVCCNPTLKCDYIPCDVAIKSMILATWKRGLATLTKDPSIHVYNCAARNIRSMTSGDMNDLGLKMIEDIPMEGILWYPNAALTSNKTVYYLLMLTLHLLPALIIDGILKLIGKPVMLVKLQRIAYTANCAYYYFISTSWDFQNKKFWNLSSELYLNDKVTFGFQLNDVIVEDYIKDALIGARLYVLKENINNIDKDKVRQKRMKMLDRCVKILLIYLGMWFLNRYGYFALIWSYMQR